MSAQYDLLKQVVKALLETIKEDSNNNESTLKHNFFHHLKLQNKNYKVTAEESLKGHINYNGRADFYLKRLGSKSYKDDVAIEFKVDCTSSNLIKHDLDKLNEIKKLNRFIAPIFINIFSKELNFREYLLKTQPLFENTKSYSITLCPKLNNFFVRDGLQILERKLPEISFIINHARFIETKLISTDYNVIRLPNKGGMSKQIHLYPQGRENYRGRTKTGTIDPKQYIIYCDPFGEPKVQQTPLKRNPKYNPSHYNQEKVTYGLMDFLDSPQK